MPLQAWGFSSGKCGPSLLVHSDSHLWPPSLEGLVSLWAMSSAPVEVKGVAASLGSPLSIYLSMLFDDRLCSHPAFEDVGWASPLPGSSTLCTHLKAQGSSSQEENQWLWWRHVPPDQLPSTAGL